MFKNFPQTLEIVVNGMTSETLEKIQEENEITVWIIVLIILLAVLVFLGIKGPDIIKKIKQKKADRKQFKNDKKRDDELERLHEIKRKNKRK